MAGIHEVQAGVDLLTRDVASGPRVECDAYGKPVLPLEPAVIYRFGHLIRSTEQLLLDLFSKGLLSGTTHTCIGQELC